jgi:LPS-assembly lipoprotein
MIQPSERFFRLLRVFLLGMLGISLAGCGFKMQGITPLPFDSLTISIPQNSQFGADVRRAVRAASPNTKIIEPATSKLVAPGEKLRVDPASLAQARLVQVSSVRNSRIVSLNAQGKAEEFELTLVYTFRLVNAKNQIILPDTTLSAARSMPFDDRVVQAKEGEAATLFRDMQKSMVVRIIRRLTAPDVKQRWDELNANPGSEEDSIEQVAPAQEPSVLPTPWQNPPLIPLPIPVNPDG